MGLRTTHAPVHMQHECRPTSSHGPQSHVISTAPALQTFHPKLVITQICFYYYVKKKLCACLPHVADGLRCPGPRPAQREQCQLRARAMQTPFCLLSSAAPITAAPMSPDCLGQLFAV